MIITVSSLPGAGSSTAARLLAERLRIERVDAGDIWDRVARERGVSVLGLNLAAENDKSIDVALDEKILALARASGDRLLEARLIGWMCHRNNIPAFKIWVACPLEIRAKRIAAREHASVVAMTEETRQREASEAKRYKMYYNIDITNLSIYDSVVDSSEKNPEAIVAEMIAHIPKIGPKAH